MNFPPICRQSGVPLPLLLSVVGDDIAGDALLRHWQSSVGAPHRCISRVEGARTPIVSVIMGNGGEVSVPPSRALASLLKLWPL